MGTFYSYRQVELQTEKYNNRNRYWLRDKKSVQLLKKKIDKKCNSC